MATWLIGVVMLIYAYCGIEFLLKGDYANAIVYFSYATANIGLIIIAGRPLV